MLSICLSDRILRYAAIVGRENVIADTDCGLGGRVHAPTECVRARPAPWQAADGAWNALPGVERQWKVDDRGID